MHTARDFRTSIPSLSPSGLPDSTAVCLFHFDLFAQSNSFTGQQPMFLSDVRSLMKNSGSLQGEYLLNAMLALGAMQAHTLGVSVPRGGLRFALESYQKSLAGLRDAVSNFSAKQRDSILWCTFFLGLFELMQDASGQKWLQHMVFGTAQALVASGPATCESGTMRTFFVQARTFEVCRSVIFNQPSFLATPEWMSLTDRLASGNGAGQSSLNEILKLVVLCSSLRARTGEFIETLAASSRWKEFLLEALQIATEGTRLRQELEKWRHGLLYHPEGSEEMLLSIAYHAATSIYLSGNYDYDLARWQAMEVEVPVLGTVEIANHFEVIVLTVRQALKESTLSPLLFLFPLRVAGARANLEWQRGIVTGLLGEIRRQFVVADAMLLELRELWSCTPIMVLS